MAVGVATVPLAELVYGDGTPRFAFMQHANRCPCRKCHPYWSGSMLVFMEHAAETVAPADIKADGGGQFRGRRGSPCSGRARPLEWAVIYEAEFSVAS